MKVKLITHTPDALKVAFTAIRTCYSPYEFEYIWEEEFDKYVEKNDDHIRLVKQIVSHGHTSTLEHISFEFSLEGVSRALLAQLTRHRVGFSYSVQSQRYVKMSTESKHGGFEYVVPPSVDTEQKMEEFYDIMNRIQVSYDALIKLGVAAEDARYILPNAAKTNLILSCNLRSFIDFYNKRKPGTHAQWEIQNLAEAMRNEIVAAEPWTKDLF